MPEDNVGRRFAGVLGTLAFAVTISRGVWDAVPAELCLKDASVALAVFSAVGWLIGHAAEIILFDALHRRFQEEMKAREVDGATGKLATPRE